MYKTTIVSVSYGCETWSVALREEQRLRVFENSVVRIFEHTKEITETWRKLHSEKLHNLYFLPDVIRAIKSRTIRWARHIERIGYMRYTYNNLVRKPEGRY
jgi:hypothetical protein